MQHVFFSPLDAVAYYYLCYYLCCMHHNAQRPSIFKRRAQVDLQSTLPGLLSNEYRGMLEKVN